MKFIYLSIYLVYLNLKALSFCFESIILLFYFLMRSRNFNWITAITITQNIILLAVNFMLYQHFYLLCLFSVVSLCDVSFLFNLSELSPHTYIHTYLTCQNYPAYIHTYIFNLSELSPHTYVHTYLTCQNSPRIHTNIHI